MGVDQQAMDELKEQLARVSTQRVEAEKENNILRKEIAKLKELYQQSLQSSRIEGGSKVDSGVQTDETVDAEIEGNILNHKVTDQATREKNNRDKFSQSENNFKLNENRKSVEYLNKRCSSSDGCRNDKQDELVSGLMNYFQSLQVTIPLPKFDGIKRKSYRIY